MPEFCPECETMSERRIVDVEETLPVLGTPITIRAQAAQCVACGKLVEDERLDSISLKAAYDVYYERTGIRLPRETDVPAVVARYAGIARATTGEDREDVASALREMLGDPSLVEGRGSANRLMLPDDAPKQRTAGLNRGSILLHPNFDDPLPDEFWMGEE